MAFTPNYKLQVFVLGAGFSRSFCNTIPLLSSLTDLLFDEKKREATLYPDLCNYIRNVYKKSNEYIGIKDIEAIATVILTKRIYRDDVEKQRFSTLRYQMLKFISDKLKPFAADKDKAAILEQFIGSDWLFRTLEDIRRRRVFISLNYDLIIERLGIPVDYGVIRGYEQLPYRYHNSSKFIECIKLHGSLNWFRAKENDNFDINSVYVVNENDSAYSIHCEDIPVFIPMAHSKDSFLTGSLFSTLWAKAINDLEKADDIYFIGYGFPPSDINNLFLFLNFKKKIRKVVVHYEDDGNRDLERLRNIFGSDVVINKDAKSFIESDLI